MIDIPEAILAALDDYWDAAYSEGCRRANTEDADGSGQSALYAVYDAIAEALQYERSFALKARENALEDAAEVAENMPSMIVTSPDHVRATTPFDVSVAIRNLHKS